MKNSIFDSKDELEFSKELTKRGLKWTYHSETIILLPPLKTCLKNYLKTSYTPDFEFEYKNKRVIVEVKGFTRNDDALRIKLASYHYHTDGKIYLTAKLSGTIKDNNKGWYIYGKQPNKNMKNRPTFWDKLDECIKKSN